MLYLSNFSMAPAARLAMTRRVHPLLSLNPYQGNWTIKVRVTSKGNMRTYKNARGEGCVFNGTQIQATMFNEAARKFYDKFQLGKVYYISKGTLKVANKQFMTVHNDYEMTLNENSEVEEAKLLDISDKSPIVAIKSLKVGDFQGISLSALSKSIVVVNPETAESKKLRSWYDAEGKETSMASVGAGMSPTTNSGGRSMYSDRVSLSHITGNPSLGEDKPVFFSIRAYISLIKPDQSMWYRACKTCNKKVTEVIGSGYYCEVCQKYDNECSLRYIMVTKVSDASGEAWFSAFSEQAEKIIGCSADELDKLKSQQEGKANPFELKLKNSNMGSSSFPTESRFLLEDISKMKASQ
ncbi:RPA70-kDa subunit B [Actinidia rufa]|uniref:RPA70-kDa subunit B n=1 Tax=Actinidia rufa TaxID=165716 RepID=A0A7J0DQR9_9ERIC|nr:RPA70-kDa subunit B [Actinidia rufa]